MYLRIKNQKSMILEAIEKAGSYRKLAKMIKIPRSSIIRYVKGSAIPKDRFDQIANLLKIKDKKEAVQSRLEKNFRQKMGGKKCVLSKKEKGTFKRDMKRLQNIQSKKLKMWHKFMKKNKPEEYYQLQYSRFKKIGGYHYKTKKGENVRNQLEKDIADLLYKMKIEYKYETLIKINNRYFFPDFLINDKIIIECTMWKGMEKAHKLKAKIRYLTKKYQVLVVIPKTLYRYYKILNNHLIKGLDEFVPVAQTFLGKTRIGATGRASDC